MATDYIFERRHQLSNSTRIRRELHRKYQQNTQNHESNSEGLSIPAGKRHFYVDYYSISQLCSLSANLIAYSANIVGGRIDHFPRAIQAAHEQRLFHESSPIIFER